MEVAPILPTAHTYTHGWMLYVFLWDANHFPFSFDLDDSTVFVPVATFAVPKPDGTFCTPQTVYARKNFDLGESERGFYGTWSWTISSACQVVVLRPDLVILQPDGLRREPPSRYLLRVSPTAF